VPPHPGRPWAHPREISAFEEEIVTIADLAETMVILLASGIDLAVALLRLKEARHQSLARPDVDNDGDR
jgi:hypothetical protein